ncbi:hypothetical protein ABFX02_05G009300 [Erythranthe guttata]
MKNHCRVEKLYTMIKFKPHFSYVDILLSTLYTLMIKIYGFFCKYVCRKGDEVVVVSDDSTVFLPRGISEEDGLDLQESRKDEDGIVATVFLQSECKFVRSENMIEYFVEQPQTEEFVVEEMFVGSNEVRVGSDDSFDCEISRKSDKKILGFGDEDEEESGSSFRFSLFDASLSRNEVVCEEREELSCVQDEEIMEEHDFSYEVELIPFNRKNESGNWMSDFLDRDRDIEQRKPRSDDGSDDDDDDYIELELMCVKDEELLLLQKQDIIQSEAVITTAFSDSSDEEKNRCDSDSDSDDEEEDEDVLSEHENLVQQMKMELKNCSRIKGLPTISEEFETPKIEEDLLKPLQIDRKIEYKDVINEIQNFYKCYTDKMRKLDILNYQTLQAISFLQLKESEVLTACKKKADYLTPSILPKFLKRKVQRVYADPMQKSIKEMHRDLELIYVGKLCLSWEILCWLYVKGQELMDYDSQGHNHSYNRAAEDFQQFQVLMQRFIEDEPFQGNRNQNYVRSRCMIRSLLHVPTIKDDCSKAKKEIKEETDAISLKQLVEMIKESMLIFREFIFADKKATRNAVLKGIQEPQNSELLVDVVSKLQKKERRIQEHIRSRNCIVTKLRKSQRECDETSTSEVELRLVCRVLNVSNLTREHLLWCHNKLDNISFVGKKVHLDTSFLLFPC